MKKWFLLGVFALLLSACASDGTQDPDAQITQDWSVEKLYTEAHSELNSRNYTRAVKLYNLLQSNPTYNHVIFDLSLNGGGYNTELFKLVGMGKENFKYITHRLGSNATLPANVSVPTRFMNLDISCITSECSFSCGNIMPSYIVRRFGQVTGGGMCAVIPYVIADGTTIELSGHNAVYSPNNTPIEDGVEATTLIPYDDFFNYDKIINDYFLA